MNRPTVRDWLVVLFCATVAVGFIVIWEVSATPPGSFDIQMEYYPNMIYAARQFWSGGRGLLWNPFQNCGQPFFALSGTGLLYPPYWAFLLAGPRTALWIISAVNLTIAGAGAFALGRTLGVGRGAALCGALAFELANATADVTTWSPMVASPYVWIPLAMCCCERILRSPSLRNGVALALVLAVALLPGFPQPVLLCCQLIAMRVLWEFATQRVTQPFTIVVVFAVGLLLPPLLTAIHLLPSMEMAALSVRNRELSLLELLAGGVITWNELRTAFGSRAVLFNPFVVIPALLAAVAPFAGTRRRVALFYLATGLLYAVLSFGPGTPLFDWYIWLPTNRTFRGPARLLWMSGFCLSVLTALGTGALLQGDRSRGRVPRWLPLIVIFLAAAGLHWLSPRGLAPLEWALIAVLIAVTIVPRGPKPAWMTIVVLTTVTVNLLAFAVPGLPAAVRAWSARGRLYRSAPQDPSTLFTHARLFEWLQPRLTAQDRVAIVFTHQRFTLMPKTAELVSIPAMQDYEPAPTERSAEYAVMMRTGRPLRDLNSFYYMGGLMSPLPGPLMNLAAARYVFVDMRAPEQPRVASALPAIGGAAGVGIYENKNALPRAYYVPRVEVVDDPQALLQRLAAFTHNPRAVALIETVPASGFMGTDQPGSGTVQFVTDEPEHVVVRVDAPARGFLHLSDQYFPGWHATVNGQPQPIVRGDFLFRLVEVPAGESVVEFRYAPASLRIGAAVSAVSVILVAALLRMTRPTIRP